MVAIRTKLKISVSRLVAILFPELPEAVSSIHQASSYALLLSSDSVATGFELQQTIRLLQNLRAEINVLEKSIKKVMLEINSPFLTIPGISYTLGSIILAE